MSFERLVGHERAMGVLGRMISADRVPHALLFSGPDGVGKGLAARAVVAALNCPQGFPSCGVCGDCRKIIRGEHPDVFIPARSGRRIVKNPAGEAAGKEAFLSDIIPKLGYPPVMARVKVVFIEDAHELTETAANYLLKTLEEPPRQTLFLLTTSAEHRLLPTVISRCQRVRFSPLNQEQIVEILVGLGEDPVAAKAAARLAEGSAGRARELMHQGRVETAKMWLALLDRLPTMATADRLEAAADLLSSGGGKGGKGGSEKQAAWQLAGVLRAWLSERLEASGDQPGDGEVERFEAVNEFEEALNGNTNPRLCVDRLLARLSVL